MLKRNMCILMHFFILIKIFCFNFFDNNLTNSKIKQRVKILDAIKNQISFDLNTSITLIRLILDRFEVIDLSLEIFQISNLEILSLNYNKIHILPPQIENLKSLKSLNFISNKIKTMPKEIGNLSGLEFLFCSKNKLGSIPDEIGCLSKLSKFYLSNNNLSILPFSMK